MNTEDQNLLHLIRQEINEGITGFRKEVSAGFDSIRQEHSSFKHEVREGFDSIRQEHSSFKQEVREGFDSIRQEHSSFKQEVREGFGEVKSEFEKVHVRLDAAINMTRDFRIDVSARLDNIAAYQMAVDNHAIENESRIRLLEERVDKLEQAG